MIANRIQKVHYAIREIEDLASKYTIKYHLNIGDPIKLGVKPYPKVIRALKNRLKDPIVNGYAPSKGVKEAIDAVVQFYAKKGIKVSRDNTFITSGVSEGINFVIATLMNRGDHILLPRPNYPLYDALAKFYGLKIQYYEYDDEGNIDWNSLENLRPPKMAILINPNNPLGTNLRSREVRGFIKRMHEHETIVVADEIYSELVYRGEMYESMRVRSKGPLITMNGISKSHVSPGWRLGWMVLKNLDNEVIENINKIMELRLSAPAPLQYAMADFLNACEEDIKKYKKHLKHNAELVEENINSTSNLHVNELKAAHYAFIKVREDDRKIVERLARSGVLTVPGRGFSKPGYFRIVTAGNSRDLDRALKIIKKELG